MKIENIDAAIAVINNKQLLINLVSKRVREIVAGSRPMVEVHPEMSLASIALAEIVAGKIDGKLGELPDFSEKTLDIW